MAIIMLLGVFINEIFNLMGMTQPLSEWLALTTISCVVLAGAILGEFRNKESQSLTAKIPLYILIIFVSIAFLGGFGIFSAIVLGNNLILLIFLLATLALVILSMTSEKMILAKYYPFVLFTICLSLLLFACNETPFITPYITGRGDQWIEYYAFRLTQIKFYWNSTFVPSPLTPALFPTYSMLSVTILPTIFSQMAGLDVSWTAKVIYPFIVSFVVIGVYKLYETQTNRKAAFLAAFYFITISSGKGWGSEKQMIAQLFYVLLFYLIFNKKISSSQKNILFVLFAFGLVVSHYALNYIFIFIILFSKLAIYLVNYFKTHTLIIDHKIPLAMMTLFLTTSFSWYLYVNAGESFNILLDSINTVQRNINEFTNPQSRGSALQGLGLVEAPTILHRISVFLFLLSEIFLVIGFLIVVTSKQMSFSLDYVMVCASNLLIIAMNLLLPRLADTFLMSRFFQTTLIILAPLEIVGIQCFSKYIPKPKIKSKNSLVSFLMLVFLGSLFLFQTGFVYEVAKVHCESLPLSMYRWDNLRLHNTVVRTTEVYGAFWLSHHTTLSHTVIHADLASKFHVLLAYGLVETGRISLLSNRTKWYSSNEFTYLGYLSTVDGKVQAELPEIGYYIFNVTQFTSILENQNKIYSNGECEIYRGS
ncbi:MAG: DUF2206 domain-containing protein [Candidatus Bathyarchaeia archaeon]